MKFKTLLILLDGECSSTIIIKRLITKLNPTIYNVIQWHMQTYNINTNLKVQIGFTLPEISAATVETRGFHVYESDKGRYDIILDRYLSIVLVSNIYLFDHVI